MSQARTELLGDTIEDKFTALEKQDQVERLQGRELAPPDDARQHDEEHEDDDRAEDDVHD